MRNLVALTLAGVLALGTAAPALAHEKHEKAEHKESRFEGQFKDWTTDFWANESLARMVTKGVIKGNDDGTIASVRPVTRLEAAIMLARLLELKPPEVPYGEYRLKAPWGEVKIEHERDNFELKLKTREGEVELEDDREIPRWGRDAILIGLKHGFLIFDGARLSPMAPLNRLEAAMMLVKAAGLDEEARAKANAELSFSDAGKIPDRLKGYIAIAVEKGFVTGYDDGTFNPQKLVSRAEWAALLDRLDRKGAPVSADGRQVRGTVTAVAVGTAPSITMTTPVFPGGVTYPVDDSAVIYKDRKAATIANVAVGDQVIINLSSDREILLVTVHNVPRHVGGIVTAYTAPTDANAGSLILNADGTSETYAVPATLSVSLGKESGAPADVRVGDSVSLTLEGAQLKRIAIKVEAVKVMGTLSVVTPGSGGALPTLTVAGADNTSSVYSVADHATIAAEGGAALTLADLKAGDQVTLKVERNLVVRILRTQTAAVQSGFSAVTTADLEVGD